MSRTKIRKRSTDPMVEWSNKRFGVPKKRQAQTMRLMIPIVLDEVAMQAIHAKHGKLSAKTAAMEMRHGARQHIEGLVKSYAKHLAASIVDPVKARQVGGRLIHDDDLEASIVPTKAPNGQDMTQSEDD